MTRKTKQSPYIHKQEEWKKLYESGLSFTEIGKREGVNYTAVQTVLRGVVTPRPKQTYAHLAKKWAELYQEGYSSNEIAITYKADVSTVTKYLKKEGVEIRKKSGKKKQFEHLTDTWIALYNNGKSLKEIAEQHGTFPQTVHDYIHQKTEMRKYTETSRQYSLNEHYFDRIDSKEKAYWLGMMYSSGSVINDINGGGIQLSISAKDRDRVEAFQQVMESNKPITERIDNNTSGHQVVLRLHSLHLHRTLQALGLISNKTETLVFPHWLEVMYLPAFILGYYEGKGSCYNSSGVTKGKRYTHTCLDIFGTETFLKSMQQILNDYAQVDIPFKNEGQRGNFSFLYTKENDKTIPILTTGKRNLIERFALWLYQDADTLFYSKKRDIRAILKQSQSTKTGGEQGDTNKEKI